MGEIARRVQECLAEFRLLAEHPNGETELVQPLYTIDLRTRIGEEYARFKIWAGNLSAHALSGRRSLDYRLRDSENLKSTVLDLLQELLESLQSLLNVSASADEEASESDSEEVPALAELWGPQTKSEAFVEDVHDIVQLLYRFSMTLRNPAGHTRIKYNASSTATFYYTYDLEHVQQKFPTAATVLQQRLARAISARRQHFKYREEHHGKLTAGIEEEQEIVDPASTVATSVQKEVEYPVAVSVIESVYSVNSFAPTESETGRLKPPPLPDEGQDEQSFECPICFTIVCVRGEQSWNQHVFEDITPYQCTHEHCIDANIQYLRRQEWQQHQMRTHYSIWTCPFGCPLIAESPAELQSHLVQQHGQEPGSLLLANLIDSSATRSPNMLDLECPLCRKMTLSESAWFKHVGKHFEQLALHALPSHLFDDESSEDAQGIRSDVDEQSGSDHDGDLSQGTSSTPGSSSPPGISPDTISHRDPKELLKSELSNYSCQICSKTFSKRGDLNKHERCHVPKFDCMICSKSFHFQKDLDRHTRTHRGRPFKCPVQECLYREKGFVRKDHLARHIRTQHPNSDFDISSDKEGSTREETNRDAAENEGGGYFEAVTGRTREEEQAERRDRVQIDYLPEAGEKRAFEP